MEWYNVVIGIIAAIGGVGGIIAIYKARPEKEGIVVKNMREMLDEAHRLYDEMKSERNEVRKEFDEYKDKTDRRFDNLETKLDKTEGTVTVLEGFITLYGGNLWKARQTHTVLEVYPPSLNTASLYEVIVEEHEGTIDDPIPYTPPMEIFEGKYYTQYDVLYKCTRNSGTALSHDLFDLRGLYVELIER